MATHTLVRPCIWESAWLETSCGPTLHHVNQIHDSRWRNVWWCQQQCWLQLGWWWLLRLIESLPKTVLVNFVYRFPISCFATQTWCDWYKLQYRAKPWKCSYSMMQRCQYRMQMQRLQSWCEKVPEKERQMRFTRLERWQELRRREQ